MLGDHFPGQIIIKFFDSHNAPIPPIVKWVVSGYFVAATRAMKAEHPLKPPGPFQTG
jgi:hypothetical protein